jgi:hypothetical protein
MSAYNGVDDSGASELRLLLFASVADEGRIHEALFDLPQRKPDRGLANGIS